MPDETHEDIVRRVEDQYAQLRNDVFHDEVLREVLKPLDEGRDLIQKKAATLATMREEYKAGRLADDQVPRLRRALVDEVRKAAALADKAARQRVEDLPGQLTDRIFTSPPRTPDVADRKQDLLLKARAARDPNAATQEALQAAIRSRDTVTLQLLADDWWADALTAEAGADRNVAHALRDEVRARVVQDTPDDLFPQAVRNDLQRLRRLKDVQTAFACGLNLLDMERESLERWH